MKRELVILITAAMGLTACGGGGGSSVTNNTNSDGEVLSSLSTGYALPTEISAVPADNSGNAAQLARGLTSRLHALASAVSDLPAASDYSKASTRKFVEERSLEQFDIIEQVMSALAQTNYADQANINAGPYKAMIAWEDEQNGVSVKQLQPWVVESRMIVINGQDVNRLLAWIEENDGGQVKLIKAEFKVYSPATQKADGSYANYGEWDLNVKFDDSGSDFFAATARIVNGQTVLKINESQQREEQGQLMTFSTKAVMHRSGAQGYGKVQYPDMNCNGGSCQQTTNTVNYAYNGDYLALQKIEGTSAGQVVFKDRNAKTEFARRYGLFYANDGEGIAAGDDVQKHKAFGFPVRYTDENGATQHAYYGAWQGRHQLWANGGSVPLTINGNPTVLTREDRGPNQAAQTFTVSAPFAGTLTKRRLVAGEFSDIQNIAVETFVSKHFDLRWDASGGGAWKYCTGYIDFNGSPTCKDPGDNSDIGFSTFGDYASLVMSENDRKQVNIGRWDNVNNMPKDYVYLAADPNNLSGYSGTGFYEAHRDNMGRLTPVNPAQKLVPVDGDNLGVNIGGSVYIQYTGDYDGATDASNGTVTTTGWVQKQLASFDQQTWTASFIEGGDSEFTPEPGRDYYIHSNGTNFVVKRKNANSSIVAGDYEVWIELQTAANPVNFTSILPVGTSYLRTPWRPDVRFGLVTDTTSDNFLKLVYLTDDPNTQDDEVGTLHDSGEWGLRAYSDNGIPGDFTDDKPLKADGALVTADPFTLAADQRPVEFNWEYSQQEGGWGTQQFLVNGDGYVILSDPIQISVASGAAVNADGAPVNKPLSLQFDGWMHGLPDLYNELSKNNWVMDSNISSKVINIPEGTLVTDGNNVQYYLKPLEVSVFLNEVGVPGNAPAIDQAENVSLDSGMPVFVEHNMGALPANTVVKYSEGKAVE